MPLSLRSVKEKKRPQYFTHRRHTQRHEEIQIESMASRMVQNRRMSLPTDVRKCTHQIKPKCPKGSDEFLLALKEGETFFEQNNTTHHV